MQMYVRSDIVIITGVRTVRPDLVTYETDDAPVTAGTLQHCCWAYSADSTAADNSADDYSSVP